MADAITIKGAREHNLKNVSIVVPRNKFVVFTGLSGSGKSSLAFDTIYAEGQRRYLESLSAYARQFLEQLKKPEVDSIEGLSPSISIEQKNISRNPRSTVGTVTEIYDYMRLLFARVGTPLCFNCGNPIQSQTTTQILDQILALPQGTKLSILSPIARGKKGEFQKELNEVRAKGFSRVRIDGEDVTLSAPIKLKKTFKHDISVYIDRIAIKAGIETRLMEAIEMAIEISGGTLELLLLDNAEIRFFSTKFACTECGSSFPEIEPRCFSFNNQQGQCEACLGLGTYSRFDPILVIPNHSLSLKDGAIAPWEEKSKASIDRTIEALSHKYKFKPDAPFGDLSEEVQKVILYGSGEENLEFKVPGKSSFKQPFEGVIPALEKDYQKAKNSFDEYQFEQYLTYLPCETCKGTRLKKEFLSVMIQNKNIAQISEMAITDTIEFVKELRFSKSQNIIAIPILKEIQARLDFLNDVGLSYLSLSRSAATLSGGEAQRIRLATQIGSNMVGVLYVLDEPSIGLHQRDNEKLIQTLEKLRDIGNSVIVVEHDEETIERSDFVVDMGPMAGKHGGEIIFAGDPKELRNNQRSITGKYLSHEIEIPVPPRRAMDPAKVLKIIGASENNLKNLDITFPLGLFVCVSGVSGSGKSSLIIDTLLTNLSAAINQKRKTFVNCAAIEGIHQLDKVVHVDQSPIGRTPRSNPATYTGVFSDIRTLFANLPDSQARGFKPGRFSFNVAGGRCEACSGDGNLKISMSFLPDVFVECEVCRGKRYNRETLEVFYRGKNIADVLKMSVEEAVEFFARIPQIHSKLETLLGVGLSYIELGQNAVTLSGGEAQRIKLAKELNRRATGRTIYILDEPTTGLHFEDVRRLLEILQLLVNQGNTVIVIEHNLDVIKQADFLIDLGPEGGKHGGEIVVQGTPEEVAKHPTSFTGIYLKKILKRHKRP